GHARFSRDWSSDVCSSDLLEIARDEAKRAAIRAWRSVRKRRRPPAPEFKEPRTSLDRVMVYREADFLELARDFSELADTISEFGDRKSVVAGKRAGRDGLR